MNKHCYLCGKHLDPTSAEESYFYVRFVPGYRKVPYLVNGTDYGIYCTECFDWPSKPKYRDDLDDFGKEALK